MGVPEIVLISAADQTLAINLIWEIVRLARLSLDNVQISVGIDHNSVVGPVAPTRVECHRGEISIIFLTCLAVVQAEDPLLQTGPRPVAGQPLFPVGLVLADHWEVQPMISSTTVPGVEQPRFRLDLVRDRVAPERVMAVE